MARTKLPKLHQAILEACKGGHYPLGKSHQSAYIALHQKGYLRRKVVKGVFGHGRNRVKDPLTYLTTPAGERALKGEGKPEGPKAKRERKAGSMSRQACRKIVLERDGYRCRLTRSRCTVIATEVHELKSKARGGSDRDPNNCVGSCHNCNQDVHNNGKDAMEKGHLLTGHVHVIPSYDRAIGEAGPSL